MNVGAVADQNPLERRVLGSRGRQQTAQLGSLNHEMNVANANGLRKIAAASQEVSANSAKLADTMRQLSDNLASQLKELTARLDAIQERISNVK